ncbi:MAG TPA: two-component regulator propeller domain-containing protein [Bacteroidia bacterium]
MGRSFKIIIYCLLLQILFFNGFCQQFNFRNYSVKDGVAQSQVYSLLQDSRGYLWMGTRGGGITRFDGLNFKTLTIKDGLVNNYVFCIKEDRNKNLWIGTNNGLSKYNGVRFQNIQPSGDSSQVWIQDIDFDEKDRKWLATNVGILLLDDKGITNITELLQEKKSVINALLVAKDKSTWYGNAEGLFRINEKNGKYSVMKYGKTAGFMNNSITSIKQDAKGNLWIGTYGDGAYVYDGSKFFRIDLGLELYKQTILDIYFDNHDNVWLATLSSGIAEYNTIAKTFTWLSEKEGLSNNHVRSIIQDKNGNYWFGTSGGGVCNYFGKQFTHYDKSSGLGGNFIYSIFRDSRQRLWIGTSDKGTSIFDSSKFTNYSSQNGFADVKVKAIHEDNNGIIYLGTDGQGVFTYDGTAFNAFEGLTKKHIRGIVKDKNGNMWFATAGTGLFKLDVKENKLKNFTTKDGLLHDRLTCLWYDKQGRIWYGTENNGLGLIANEVPQKKSITTKDGLKSNSIRSITEDRNGYLWLGTAGYGVACFPLYQGDTKIYTVDHTNGLTSSNIYLLVADMNSNIFIGTETGLDLLQFDKERKLKEIKHFSRGEGFTGIETCQNSVYKDKDGTIWFGTINGLSRYNPANQVKNESEPITTISDVKLFYKSIATTEFKNFAGDWNTITALNLPYDQNHLSFNFSGINFSNPEAVKYQWKLEGFDPAWSPVSKENNIVYSNINPGTYTFMVKACNEDGVWNREPTIIKIHISAPFWKRWWFIALVVIILIGLLVLLFKWRENRIRASAKEKQRKLQLEKDVVELEQKALRLQMNPHFIFNALNSIQSQIGTDNEQTARYYLAKFSRLMRQILDNSRNTAITLEEEVNTLENYLLIEKFCNGDRFDYSIVVDPSIEQDFVKIPPMILQPFVENAIKHGLKFIDGKRGVITVEFREKENILECSVTDNGIGRKRSEELNKTSKETYHKSTALLVTQERLDILQTDKEIKSLEIIDLYNEKGNAEGTKVMVRISLG